METAIDYLQNKYNICRRLLKTSLYYRVVYVYIYTQLFF